MLAAKAKSGEPQRTWDEIAELVHEMKVLQFKLSIRTCHDFTVRSNPVATDSKRVYFLGVPEPALSGKSTIMYFDFEDTQMEAHVRKSECKQLMGDLATTEQYSKDEALLRERKRMGTIGISSYELHQESGRIVFPANGGLYTLRDDFSASGYQPVEIVTPVTLARRIAESEQRPAETNGEGEEAAGGACLDAKLSPGNANLIAYVYCNDMWLSDIQTGSAQRLTFTQPAVTSTDGVASKRKQFISAGVPSFVTQEEFDRFSGFWWQPHVENRSPSKAVEFTVQHLLYEEVDESEVPVVKLINASGAVEKFRYPRAGKPNARSRLKMLKLTRPVNTSKNEPFTVEELSLPKAVEQELFEGDKNEYLVRAGWLPHGDAIWLRLLDRVQQELRLVVVPLSSFSANGLSNAVYHNLLSITDTAWVNVDDCFHFLNSSTLERQEVLIAHEQTGYRHLSLFRCAVKPDGTVESNETVLTSGEWEVHKKTVWLDERARLVYFLAGRDSPLTRQLYRVRLDANVALADAVERVSDSNWYLHEVTVGNDYRAYCASVSNPDTMQHLRVYSLRESSELRSTNNSTPSLTTLRAKPPSMVSRTRMELDDSARCASESRNSLDSLAVNASTSVASSLTDECSETLRRDADVADVDLNADADVDANADALPVPEASCSSMQFGMYRSDADTLRCMRGEPFEFVRAPGEPVLHGLVFKPLELLLESDSSKRYPTVIYAYGGPQIQLITRSYLPANLVRLCGFVRLGYIVVVVDNRGSAGRGHRFEAALRFCLGHKEAADQVSCVRWLASRYPIDLARVGIYGWSYGGYLSLMTLAQYPAAIRCAAACAPVTDWHLYDSGYTERYLDLPDTNVDGYSESSVLSRSRALPNEPGRLLLVHGYADENVHFSHTAELLRLLVSYGKPYQLLMYPDERHGFRTLEASEHFETNLLYFFETNLRHAPISSATAPSPTRAATFEI